MPGTSTASAMMTTRASSSPRDRNTLRNYHACYGRCVARFPSLSVAGNNVPASIFAKLREHLARYKGDVIPLQIGDTHLHPPATMHSIEWASHAPVDLYAY